MGDTAPSASCQPSRPEDQVRPWGSVPESAGPALRRVLSGWLPRAAEARGCPSTFPPWDQGQSRNLRASLFICGKKIVTPPPGVAVYLARPPG